MKTKHSDLVEKLTVRVNAEVVSAIQKSGQSAPDWLRQAARNRIDDERQAETPTGKLEKQVAALQQRIDDLKKDGIDTRKEIARLQQSETIVQAALLDMRKNHVELRRSLEQMNAGFGHAFNALGQSLLVALSQQLRELVKAQEEPPKRPLPPILPRTRL
jgi:predicted  nucleic acid-binding Zn-ribbon protein